MTALATQWAAFERLVIPAAAPAVQRQEMRRAFYAGAQAMLTIADTLAASYDMTAMAVVERELHQFAVDVIEGRA